MEFNNHEITISLHHCQEGKLSFFNGVGGSLIEPMTNPILSLVLKLILIPRLHVLQLSPSSSLEMSTILGWFEWCKEKGSEASMVALDNVNVLLLMSMAAVVTRD